MWNKRPHVLKKSGLSAGNSGGWAQNGNKTPRHLATVTHSCIVQTTS